MMYYLLFYLFHEILAIYFSLVKDSLKILIKKSGTFSFLNSTLEIQILVSGSIPFCSEF